MRVYFDNAATTPLAPEVLDVMLPLLRDDFGNPSSTHQFGRKTKSAIEMARKTIAKLLHCSPMEICFTSGGTEADNMAIHGAIEELGVTRIISSLAEHHAVLHTVEHCQSNCNVELEMVRLTDLGHVDVDHLKELLASSDKKTLVSLMHANNEIGTMIDIDEIGQICEEYGALFHSDTVQTMGHFPMDLSKTKVHFITGAAHKFHGPKGVGFLYINKDVHVNSLIRGGSQERNMRAGTENIYGIVGMAKALEMALEHVDEHREHIQSIKDYMCQKLREEIHGSNFNGCLERSLYTVLNVRLPKTDKAEMLLFLLDIDGIACSGGSACSSGSNQGSHVLRAINADTSVPSIRFSFSRYSTKEEVDYVVSQLSKHLVTITSEVAS
ncbi:cysteine desulfurase family protein [Cryomorphaceae bacterium 1068]|nr:cysteine desulfurase family protein [Cryomorphaceae bacterium 1068]